MEERYYSIGEVSELCNISRKALRYYEDLGLITPDKKGLNNYRYYSRNTILLIPIIKYYKQMGFTLDEMKNLVAGCDYSTLLNQFNKKVREFEGLEKEIYNQKVFVTDWYNLISEAQFVIENDMQEVSVKFKETQELCAMPYDFTGDYAEATINIEFTMFLEKHDLQITGPVMILFPALERNRADWSGKVTVIQKSVKEIPEPLKLVLNEGMYASAYHIGSMADIQATYDRIFQWLDTSRFKPKGSAVERYVTDYWTTPNAGFHVTEILIPVEKKNQSE